MSLPIPYHYEEAHSGIHERLPGIGQTMNPYRTSFEPFDADTLPTMQDRGKAKRFTRSERIVELFLALRLCLEKIRKNYDVAAPGISDDLLHECHQHVRGLYLWTISETHTSDPKDSLSEEDPTSPTVAMFLMTLSLVIDVYATVFDSYRKLLDLGLDHHTHTPCSESPSNRVCNFYDQTSITSSRKDGQYGSSLSELSSKRHKSHHLPQPGFGRNDQRPNCPGQVDHHAPVEIQVASVQGSSTTTPRRRQNVSSHLKVIERLAAIDFHIAQLELVIVDWMSLFLRQHTTAMVSSDIESSRTGTIAEKTVAIRISDMLNNKKIELKNLRTNISRSIDLTTAT